MYEANTALLNILGDNSDRVVDQVDPRIFLWKPEPYFLSDFEKMVY